MWHLRFIFLICSSILSFEMTPALAACYGVVNCSSAPDIPISPATKIEVPSPNVPPGTARWSGAWFCQWGAATAGASYYGDGLPAVLLVESILPSGDMEGVYAWGSNPKLSVAPGSTRIRSKINEGRLVFGTRFIFQASLRLDGRLELQRYRDGALTATCIMDRVELSHLMGGS